PIDDTVYRKVYSTFSGCVFDKLTVMHNLRMRWGALALPYLAGNIVCEFNTLYKSVSRDR
ncbi:hypothetical protein J6590_095596, partial [Homalodisca vitripennis]